MTESDKDQKREKKKEYRKEKRETESKKGIKVDKTEIIEREIEKKKLMRN